METKLETCTGWKPEEIAEVLLTGKADRRNATPIVTDPWKTTSGWTHHIGNAWLNEPHRIDLMNDGSRILYMHNNPVIKIDVSMKPQIWWTFFDGLTVVYTSTRDSWTQKITLSTAKRNLILWMNEILAAIESPFKYDPDEAIIRINDGTDECIQLVYSPRVDMRVYPGSDTRIVCQPAPVNNTVYTPARPKEVT